MKKISRRTENWINVEGTRPTIATDDVYFLQLCRGAFKNKTRYSINWFNKWIKFEVFIPSSNGWEKSSIKNNEFSIVSLPELSAISCTTYLSWLTRSCFYWHLESWWFCLFRTFELKLTVLSCHQLKQSTGLDPPFFKH